MWQWTGASNTDRDVLPVSSMTDAWRLRHGMRSSGRVRWHHAAVWVSPSSCRCLGLIWRTFLHLQAISSWKLQFRAGTEVNRRLIYLKVTPTLMCCTEEEAPACVCIHPFSLPSRLNALFWPFFNSPFHNSQLLLQAEIAATGNYS